MIPSKKNLPEGQNSAAARNDRRGGAVVHE
jgi:hypothetical protein